MGAPGLLPVCSKALLRPLVGRVHIRRVHRFGDLMADQSVVQTGQKAAEGFKVSGAQHIGGRDSGPTG